MSGAINELSRRLFKVFVLEKWKRYEFKPFLDNWHVTYMCRLMERVIPPNPNINDGYDDPDGQIKRLMINLPPSYGKTEIIARCFVPWVLGRDRAQKVIYISYSDELARKICNQIRSVIKSQFWQDVFGKPNFLYANSSEIAFEEGGGLFVTTMKGAITGFHANLILIDDPIKISDMRSRKERDRVNEHFKEGILTRMQNSSSSVIILMQRLGLEDLCGYLTNPRYFKREIIDAWYRVELQAINKHDMDYKFLDFEHHRPANTALYPLKHDLAQLEELRLSMGNDEFETQFQHDPAVLDAGFFEPMYFKYIHKHELGACNQYIFVDNAQSLESTADNRAIVCVAVDAVGDLTRYTMIDCLYGIWDEELTINMLVDMMVSYPDAVVYIESDGGGLTLKRLLDKQLVRHNESCKTSDAPMVTNAINVYTPSRRVAKVEKIRAMRHYYNSGMLCFAHSARGLEQVRTELLSFNPEKPFKKDDCIDALASCIAHESVCAGFSPKQKNDKIVQLPRRMSYGRDNWWRM